MIADSFVVTIQLSTLNAIIAIFIICSVMNTAKQIISSIMEWKAARDVVMAEKEAEMDVFKNNLINLQAIAKIIYRENPTRYDYFEEITLDMIKNPQNYISKGVVICKPPIFIDGRGIIKLLFHLVFVVFSHLPINSKNNKILLIIRYCIQDYMSANNIPIEKNMYAPLGIENRSDEEIYQVYMKCIENMSREIL